jgi:peptidoglycan/LPS O-acetylase OafA/YrhL
MSQGSENPFAARRLRLPASLAQGLNQSHLPSLDGLRALAAFLVVFYHSNLPGFPGGMGVLAFFVLSGFLITWLLLKEEERFGTVSLKMFYARRTLRIMPPFYAFWLLVVGSRIILGKPFVTGQTISSFFYVGNYYQAIFGGPNTGLSHTWSLGVEEQFYLLWPIAFLWLKGSQRRVRFLLWSIAGVWLYREFLVWVLHAPQGYIYAAFDTRADHLMIGCLLAVALREGMVADLWRFLVAVPSLTWLTIGLLVCSAACSYHYGSFYRDAVGFIVDPILIAILIVQVIAHSAVSFGAALNWRWMRYLGAISYSVYLYHGVANRAAEILTARLPLLTPVAEVIGAIAIASVSYWLLEQPLQRIRARFAPDRLHRSQAVSFQIADCAAPVDSPS